MPLSSFPALNASLNAAAAVLLLAGWILIRAGRPRAHRAVMLAAFACSTLFLASYLYYHAHVGVTRFPGVGPIRAAYFALLASHTVLAITVPPLALRTLFLAWRGRFEEHRRWARRTFPVWLYVSITGVGVYWMLYRI
ncbi:MAG: DUF420 domain-containing protein [Elusimicrobia bacterium]|nr:DUF420 domain-containing protein [Elusimicrobiota bacterium]